MFFDGEKSFALLDGGLIALREYHGNVVVVRTADIRAVEVTAVANDTEQGPLRVTRVTMLDGRIALLPQMPDKPTRELVAEWGSSLPIASKEVLALLTQIRSDIVARARESKEASLLALNELQGQTAQRVNRVEQLLHDQVVMLSAMRARRRPKQKSS